MSTAIVIEARFHGPPGTGNGGYTCGLLAGFVDDPAEITLRLPPPLDRPLDVVRREGRAQLFDGDHLVAEAETVDLEPLEPHSPPDSAEAERAAERYPGFQQHAFPTCFVCGPEREEGDGLRIFAGPLDGRTPLVAAPWTPTETVGGPDGRVRPEFVWAALDCPGAIAVGYPYRGETVLGRLAARIEDRPRVGERCVVLAWPLGEEGRKLYAATALFGAQSRLLAWGRATWIVPRSSTGA